MTDLTTIPEFPVTVRDGEPRALDLDIAERLGFERPRNIRKLIERNKPELERFGGCSTVERVVSGNPVKEYWLNEEQALLIATLSSAPNAPAVRAMLIRTFVAWRRGHLPAEFDMSAVGGMVKGILSKQLREIVPALVNAEIASRTYHMRRGRTAGEIWREHGFPKMKTTGWFGNRLAAVGCAIEGGGCGELGLTKARLFDPDKAKAWLRNGGRLMVETYIAQRQGQKVLRLVQ